MTKEEQAVIDAANRWLRSTNRYSEADLADAVKALVASREPPSVLPSPQKLEELGKKTIEEISVFWLRWADEHRECVFWALADELENRHP
jgi:hypothetical protein